MFNPASDTYYFVKNNMMLEKVEFGGDDGTGDALWRTGLSYSAYKDNSLKQSILSCYRKFTMINKKGHLYQGSRYFGRDREDDVSRDQITISLASLKVNNDIDELKELTEHLPRKISRRFNTTITTRMWMKAISGKGKYYTVMFQLLELLELIPSLGINKIIRWMFGWNKQYSQEWYCGYDPSIPFWNKVDGKWVWETKGFEWVNNGHKLNNSHKKKTEERFFYRMFDNLLFPDYALHLASWMVYTSDDTFLKKILQKLILSSTEKDNLLIQILMGNYVSMERIEEYQPLQGYRWSCRFNGSSYMYYAVDDSKLYNIIDKDILSSLKGWIID